MNWWNLVKALREASETAHKAGYQEAADVLSIIADAIADEMNEPDNG